MNIVWFKTTKGNYDILFGAEGEPVINNTDAEKKLSAFFEKDFQLGFLDSEKCLLHLVN